LLAVTRTRSRCLASFFVSLYRDFAACLIVWHEAPRPLQRSHSKRYAFGGPFHEPLLALKCLPTLAFPEMVGDLTATGEPTTAVVAAEVAAVSDAPFTLVAVTAERRAWPASGLVGL
jgi:hypothetical protein